MAFVRRLFPSVAIHAQRGAELVIFIKSAPHDLTGPATKAMQDLRIVKRLLGARCCTKGFWAFNQGLKAQRPVGEQVEGRQLAYDMGHGPSLNMLDEDRHQRQQQQPGHHPIEDAQGLGRAQCTAYGAAKQGPDADAGVVDQAQHQC